MQCAEQGGVMPLRLEPGEDVHAGVLAACQRYGWTAAFVVSGIGMLEDPELGFLTAPGHYDHKPYTGRFELLNLSGNVALLDGQPHAHLHATLGNLDYSAIGGHLFSAKVGVTVEVVLLRAGPPLRMERHMEESSGVAGLNISPA